MTESSTIEAPDVRFDATRVAIEDDATPLVRLIGRTLTRASGQGLPAGDLTAGLVGTVAIRSHDTPQAATVTFGAGVVEVTSGVFVEPDATLVVDLHARFALTEEPAGDADLAARGQRALRPPLPHWRDAAVRFWEITRDIAGIPDVLIVEAAGPDGPEPGRFGEGTTTYLVAGPADLLAGVFTGADDFLASLDAGVQVQGTLSQLSVMTAASWKVRFDV
ncbi:hypothetical protein [Nocardioides albus]|uniref:Uncharacterized protein n=1 Tax=Nocardioides albus TaxID=1841 RepID=A0A7W5F8Y2_9ACTN|nr:hypothetical protein [Nocardioides albus]MBB3089754.1 hypothetical protein [Nocardioides albus]GGU35383.1 hypothetical protein GCM10007979_37970 [Nocardioides albus]